MKDTSIHVHGLVWLGWLQCTILKMKDATNNKHPPSNETYIQYCIYTHKKNVLHFIVYFVLHYLYEFHVQRFPWLGWVFESCYAQNSTGTWHLRSP